MNLERSGSDLSQRDRQILAGNSIMWITHPATKKLVFGIVMAIVRLGLPALPGVGQRPLNKPVFHKLTPSPY